MAFPVLVVDGGPLLERTGHFVGPQELSVAREGVDALDHVDEVSAVAVGELQQPRPAFRRHGQRPLHDLFRPPEYLLKGLAVEGVENEDLAPGKQSAVEFEGGVLGSGSHQHHGPVFHVGQESVLLGPVEAVDLIHEEECPFAVFPAAGGFVEGLAQIGHARKHRRQGDEMELRTPGQDPGQRGLPAPGRPPQDEAEDLAGIDHFPQGHAGTQQVLLTGHFVEGLGAHPVGEGPFRSLRFEEESVGHFSFLHKDQGRQLKAALV